MTNISVTIPLDSALNLHTFCVKRIAQLDIDSENGIAGDGNGEIRKSYQLAADEILAAIREECPNMKV